MAAAQNKWLPAITGALSAKPIKGRITVSGYEGSELLVARLLIESGAEVAVRGHCLPRAPNGLIPIVNGWKPGARASSIAPAWNRTLRRWKSSIPTCPSAPRRWCSTPRPRAIPGLYFTNLISARPLMGPAGAGSLAQVINGALGNKGRFDMMKDFFQGVGEGHAAASGKRFLVTGPSSRRNTLAR